MSIPLKIVAPDEPGNEIDVKNPPDFEALNQAFPIPPPVQRSKRQAGFEPDLVPSKNSKGR